MMYPPLTQDEQKQLDELRKNHVKYVMRELSEDIHAAITDPSYSVATILEKLNEIKEFMTPKDYMRFRIDIHKLAHGDKIQIDKRVISVNMELQPDEKDELIQFIQQSH